MRHKFDEDLLFISEEMFLALKNRIWVSLNNNMLRELFMLKAKNKKHNHLFIFLFDRYRDENDHDTRIKYIKVFLKMVLHQFQKNISHQEIIV